MKRTEHRNAAPTAPDLRALLQATLLLDAALKRGVVVGVFEGSMEVSDEDIHHATTAVRSAIGALVGDLDRLIVQMSRISGLPDQTRLQ